MKNRTIYIIGGGPTALLYLKGLQDSGFDGKITVIVPVDDIDYSPYRTLTHSIHRNNIAYKHGIGGNLAVWGGRLREIEGNIKSQFNVLDTLSQNSFVKHIREFSNLSIAQIELLLSGNTRIAYFVNKKIFIAMAKAEFKKVNIINGTVGNYDRSERILSLKPHRTIKLKYDDEIIFCTNFYNNMSLLLNENQEANFKEHCYIGVRCKTKKLNNFANYSYKIKNNKGEQKVCAIESKFGTLELTFNRVSFLERIFLNCGFKKLKHLAHILVNVPAHRAIGGPLGTIIYWLTNIFSSRNEWLISVICEPSYLVKMNIKKNNGKVTIDALQNDYEINQRVNNLINEVKSVLKLASLELISISDGNHPIDSDNKESELRIDSGRISEFHGNPTFSLMVLAYVEGVKSGKK